MASIQFTSLKSGLNQPFIDPFSSLSSYEIENSHILEFELESHKNILRVNYTHTQFNIFSHFCHISIRNKVNPLGIDILTIEDFLVDICRQQQSSALV